MSSIFLLLQILKNAALKLVFKATAISVQAIAFPVPLRKQSIKLWK